MMEERVYYPNFVPIGAQEKNIPSPFVTSKERLMPSSNFVVSKTLEGRVLSRYSDDLWDFRPYRLSGNTGNARFDFSVFSGELKIEVKWLMFVLLFIVDSGRASGISISTSMTYFKAIRNLGRYCASKDLSIKQILQDESHLISYIKNIKVKGVLTGLSSLLSHLINLPSHVSGYKVLSSFKVEVVKGRLGLLAKDNQHPVIPNRIYSRLIDQLDKIINEVYLIKEPLSDFIQSIISSDRYARSEALQKKIGYRKRDLKPFFKEASEEHRLWMFFAKYGVSNMPSLSVFLNRIQHACRILIHIYTGMRSCESLSIFIGALKFSNGVYKISGSTSKFVGQRKAASWITSKEVVKAYDIAEMLARFVSNKIDFPLAETPVFVSISYLSLFNQVDYDGISLKVADASNKNNEIYNLLDESDFKVTADDLSELERISPFRAWESEKAFSVGSIWRFTIHQFRRSLSFYVAQSALVSLPSLKRQLKHINREMTLYYCQSSKLSDDFSGQEHIAQLISKEKPEADAVAYISTVLRSAEPLYGAHGVFIDQRKMEADCDRTILTEDRAELIKLFKKGEIAYSETPLGACTTVKPCDQKLLRSLTACLSCSRSVIKKSKLDRVIARQELFVKDLNDTVPDSVEYRTEKAELTDLIAFRERISSKTE